MGPYPAIVEAMLGYVGHVGVLATTLLPKLLAPLLVQIFGCATSWSFVGAILEAFADLSERRVAVGYVVPRFEVNFGLRRAMLQPCLIDVAVIKAKSVLPQRNDSF